MVGKPAQVDWTVDAFEMRAGHALWANVCADIHDGTEMSFHAKVKFRFPLWPDGSESLDQLAARARELAQAALTAPALVLLAAPSDWRAPGELQALALDLPDPRPDLSELLSNKPEDTA
jgi:hypothetical protein